MAASKVHPKARGLKLPKGFKRHDGGECPLPPQARVRMAILVDKDGHGLADDVLITEPQMAKYHEWEHSKHKAGLGAVVGYEPPSVRDASF